MDDRSRILKAKSGDMEAFYELIQDKKESLYKIAYAYTKNEEDAVDTISETVYRAYKSICNCNQKNTYIVTVNAGTANLS
jgi:RNA polymerase sigma-70 factor (ECF subfamily)